MLFSSGNKKAINIETDTYTIDAVSNRVNELLKYIKITAQDFQNLAKIDDLMEEHAQTIAEIHYGMLMEAPEIKKIIEEHSYFERYTTAITAYFKELTKPNLTRDYVEYRKKIGRIHSKIQLADEWYIGSYIRVYEYLLPLITKKFRRSPATVLDIILSLNRVITFDTMIVISSTQEENDYLLLENISKVMEYVITADKTKALLESVDATLEEATSVNYASTDLTTSIQ